MNVVPVILAGGIGERFWPLSRSSKPKQLLNLISKRTMAEETLARVESLTTGKTLPVIVTSQSIATKMRKAIPSKWKYDTIVEPVGKNTAPAVAITAAWLMKKYGDAVMVVLSADHNIQPPKAFINAVRYAVDIANKQEQLVVFGIKPSRPETGYGYLQMGKSLGKTGPISAFSLMRFVEKPDQKTAEKYLKSGKYMWNSGMFVWKCSVILEEFRTYMPELYKQVQKAAKKGFTASAINAFYNECEKESIDYGIMEQSKRVAAVIGAFDWDDIGSWEYVGRVYGKSSSGTTVVGNTIYEKECNDSIIVNHSPLTIAAVGLDNIAVVATGDSLLVIDRSRLPELKKYLGEMKKDNSIPKTLF